MKSIPYKQFSCPRKLTDAGREFGSSDRRIVGSSDRRIVGSSDRRIVGSSDRRIVGSSDRRIVRLGSFFKKQARRVFCSGSGVFPSGCEVFCGIPGFSTTEARFFQPAARYSVALERFSETKRGIPRQRGGFSLHPIGFVPRMQGAAVREKTQMEQITQLPPPNWLFPTHGTYLSL